MEQPDQSRQAPTVVMHVLLALTTAGLTLLGAPVAAEPASRSAEVAGPVLAAILAAMVMVAIRWPRPALVVSAAVVVTYHLADFPAIGMAWPLAVILYLAAATGAALLAGGGMVVLIVGSGIWRVYVENDPVLAVADGMAREAGLAAIAVLLGEVVYRRAVWRRETMRRFADQQRRRDRELQHDADQQRLAVAREVHDTVAHTLAVVGVQADVAAETLRVGDAERAAEAIEVVRHTNKRALQELRATVALLRGGTTDPVQREPVPSLTELPTLVARIEGSGLHVDVHGAADLDALPSPVDATAYRVVQEALTNVVRHADATHARIDVHLDGGSLHVEVTDDGHATTTANQGNGLRGMRERALAIGGQLQAGPGPNGGFHVHLSAPVESRP